MSLLYKKFNDYVEDEIIGLEIPEFIQENVNPNFELRPYQVEALSRFFYYMEKYKKRVKPTHLL